MNSTSYAYDVEPSIKSWLTEYFSSFISHCEKRYQKVELSYLYLYNYPLYIETFYQFINMYQSERVCELQDAYHTIFNEKQNMNALRNLIQRLPSDIMFQANNETHTLAFMQHEQCYFVLHCIYEKEQPVLMECEICMLLPCSCTDSMVNTYADALQHIIDNIPNLH